MFERRPYARMLQTPAILAGMALALLLTSPSSVSAQDDNTKRWGVAVSFAPNWKANTNLQERLFWAQEESAPWEGSDLAVGFVRTSARGGGWGLSYVRKRINDTTSTFTDTFQDCFAPGSCDTYIFEDRLATRDIVVNGVEVHFFIPFVRVRDRVIVGVNVGGGMGFPSGAGVVEETFTETLIQTRPGQPTVTNTQTFSDEEPAAGEVIDTFVPLIKAEVKAAVRIKGGLKVTVAAGLNAPATFGFRVGMVYVFGD